MTLDIQNLSEEFNIENIMDNIEEQIQNIRNNTENIDAYDGLQDNINRASRILDVLEVEIRNGNVTARMVEVLSQLMNSLTLASKEIITDKRTKESLQLKKEMLKYKYYELEVKKMKYSKPKNQNIILANREEILKLIKNDSKGEIIQIENENRNE